MTTRRIITAGVLLGAGLGGFIDGIVFHQLLQLHGMLSAVFPLETLVNVKINMIWDGLFHSLTWLMTALGVATLWGAGGKEDTLWSGRTFAGSLLLGWGLFNLIEGVIDHYLLGIHHVVERLQLSMFDHAFVASGLLLAVIGYVLIHGDRGQQRELARKPGQHY